MIGKTIERFRVVRRLGAGGMGEVFLAEDTELERSVALKVMSAELASDPNQRKRFRTEAKAISGLSHPNICVVHEVGETDDGRPFLAMEYVEGKTLDVIMQQRRLKLGEIIGLGIESAEALSAAHTRNIVHRDIKPGNIMLDRRGRVKLLDFGLAKRVLQEELSEATTAHAQTKSGMLLGTPYYMSPEQALGREVDGRTDIFSLGVVLYELLAGQKPFLGKTVGETINNVVNQAPEPLGLENPAYSPALDAIILKCLEKDPEKRYTSANSLADDLVKVRNDAARASHSREQPVEPKKPSIMAPLAPAESSAERAPNRSRLTMALIAILVFLSLIVAGGILIHSRKGVGPGHLAAANALPQNSVAVLPFDNFSSEPETDYLSDGLTEEITSALSRIQGLKVAARNSAFTFKGKKEDARKVGETLRVSTLLEGSIRKVGKQIRVTAQLINAADGFHLWSETYNRPADDIIAVQEDIARRIAERLQVEIQKPMPATTANLEAHKLYLQARLFWNKRTEDGLNKAVQYFKLAIDKDPGYAAAHAGLAATYIILPQYSPIAKVTDYSPLARAAANRALELDTFCAEAHAVLGNLQFAAKDFKGAEEHYRRAIQLDPNNATAHHWYGRYLMLHGHRDQALTEYSTAVDLDPLSPIIHTTIPMWYYMGGDYDRALQESRNVVNAFPDFPAARESLIAAMLMKGQYDEALPEIEKAQALLPNDPIAGLPMRGFALARLGEKAEAQKIIAKLEEQRKLGKFVDGAEAFVYLGLRDYDKVIDALERMEATQNLDEDFACEPFFTEMRALPRFQALLKRAGFKQEAASLHNDERFLNRNTSGKPGTVSSGTDGRRSG